MARTSRYSFLALATALAFSSATARADDGQVSRERIAGELDEYYAGEARSAYAVMALSTLSVGGGAALVTRSSDFARGLGWPLLVLGAVEGVGALFYAFQVRSETRHYQASLAANPGGFRDEEMLHLGGTRRRFVFYQATELALTLGGAGIATYRFAANRDAWKGAGLGLAAIGLPFLLIDAVNNRRASRYLDVVERLDPATVSVQSSENHTPAFFAVPATPFVISYGGSF